MAVFLLSRSRTYVLHGYIGCHKQTCFYQCMLVKPWTGKTLDSYKTHIQLENNVVHLTRRHEQYWNQLCKKLFFYHWLVYLINVCVPYVEVYIDCGPRFSWPTIPLQYVAMKYCICPSKCSCSYITDIL